ncbi:7806_t:CDS:2, partial [Racocetra persica]
MPKISSIKYYAVAKGEKTDQQNIEVKDKLNVWTDRYYKRNGLSDAIGGIEIYAAIRALEICDKKENLIINTDSSKKPDIKLILPELNENTNFRRLIMFPDNDGYITEYTQIKLSNKQNAFLNKKHWEFLKQHKFVLDKTNNIIKEISKEYLLELLYLE